MIGIRFLLLSLFIWGGMAVSATNGGGYSMGFQSLGLGTAVASMANIVDCTQTYWPTTEFTMSYWQKCLVGSPESFAIGCGTTIFLQQHTATTYQQFMAPSLSTTNTTLSAIGFGTSSLTYHYTAPSPAGFYAWTHWLYSYKASTGYFSFYLNGVLQSNTTYFKSPGHALNWCTPGWEGDMTLGRNFFQSTGDVFEEASGRGFSGYWDELSIWNRSITAAEIANMQTTKLVGNEPGLLLYYDMNTPDPNVAKNLAFTGSRYDLLLGRTRGAVMYYDNVLKVPTIFTKPGFAPTSPPIGASSSAPPLLVFAVPNNTETYVLAIDRPANTSVITIASLPAYASLYNTADGTVTTPGQTPLAVGDTINYSSGAVIFNYSCCGGVWMNDTFNITVDGVVAVVDVLLSTPPTIDGTASFTGPASTLVYINPTGLDPLKLPFLWKIVGWPSVGELWNIDRQTAVLTTPITPQNPYVTNPGGLFVYETPIEPIVTSYTIVLENSVGLSSAPATIPLVVTSTNYIPITLDVDLSTKQNNLVIIPLHYYDENDDIATVAITSLPKYGKLYHALPGFKTGDEINQTLNPYDAGTPQRSYATNVTGVSSYYGTLTNFTPPYDPYSPFQTLGPQNVKTYGDSVSANSFLTINGVTAHGVVVGGTPPLNYTYDPNTWFTNYGYTEYLEWEFGDTPLYALEILIGVCRGPGAVVGVKAWGPRGKWETLWSGKADTGALSARLYQQFNPQLCRTNYLTNRLRVEYDSRTIGDWVETDFVQYTGTAERLNPILYYDELIGGTLYVIYVPDLNFAGNDSFAYQASDCPFVRFHDSNDSWVRINVTATPQPPSIAPLSLASASVGGSQAIKLAATTVNNDTVTKFTIVTLPRYGSLKVDGETVTSVPFDVPSLGDVTYTSDMYAWDRQANDSFTYTASGTFNTSAPALLSISLHQPAGENPVLAWMGLFAIVVICALSYVMLIARRDHYPLRTLSLTLNLLVTTATALSINIPLHIILFSNGYSCGFYFWSYMLWPTFFALAVLIAIYRQRHMFRLERVKKKLSRDGNHEDDLEYLRYLKAATSEQRMAILAGLGALVFIVIAAALTNVANSTVGHYYCHSAPVILYSLLVYWLIACGAISAGLYYIRRDFEFTGFRRNVFYLLAYGLSLGVLYILLIAVVQGSDQFRSFALLLVLIPLIYQFMAVLRPCFLTFTFLRKTASEEEGLEPLSEIIITQKGFAWFLEFCMVEFSQESPLCWRAIQNFKVKTSYAAMKDIYSKYFAPNAPLAVNLSSRSMKDMQMTCPSKNEETPLQELQSIFNLVQVELLHLMQEDSYLRFVASSYYRRFKKGERVPRREHTHTPSTDSGASGTPHAPGSSGSKGSKGSKTAVKDQRSVESQGSQGKEDSKGTAIDPLTGGWAYESGEEPTDTSARPAGGAGLSNSRHLGLVDLETVRESVDEASPSAGEVPHEEGPAIEMSSRRTLTAEEHGLRETLIFNSNPLSKRPE